MQQLEGFHYSTALDINMGYYTIHILPYIQYTTAIVTEFRKFRYNNPPMIMCALGDISQAKVDELLGDIKGVNMYIDDTLVFIKH